MAQDIGLLPLKAPEEASALFSQARPQEVQGG